MPNNTHGKATHVNKNKNSKFEMSTKSFITLKWRENNGQIHCRELRNYAMQPLLRSNHAQLCEVENSVAPQ